ncbi:flavin reductase family protein [Shewanella marisflavi]|uniref:flavin reductase family protein n=1 Tax=Shewanella marisflavi TaxID=260364 RepID=UPI003AABC954
MVNRTVHIDQNQLAEMEQRYRAHLVNSLSGFKSANLIGTISESGQTNLAIVSSVFHLGADPALVGFISRPNSVARDTLSNIIATSSYTINQVNSDIWQQAHQTSARYQPQQCEFAEVGLTPEYYQEVQAPFVAQSQLKYGVKLESYQRIELNQTFLVIGSITDILLDDVALKNDGSIDIEQLNSVCVSGLDCYHRTERLGRLSYAKPGKPSTLID